MEAGVRGSLAMKLIWLLVMLAMILDQEEITQCTSGEHASRKARRGMTPSFEISVVLTHCMCPWTAIGIFVRRRRKVGLQTRGWAALQPKEELKGC